MKNLIGAFDSRWVWEFSGSVVTPFNAPTLTEKSTSGQGDRSGNGKMFAINVGSSVYHLGWRIARETKAFPWPDMSYCIFHGFRIDVDMDESCSTGSTVCSKSKSIAPFGDHTKTSDKEEEEEDDDDDTGVFKDPMEITKGITKDFRKKLAERSRSSSSGAPDDSLLTTSFLEGGETDSDSVYLYSSKKIPEKNEQGNGPPRTAAPEDIAIKELLKPKPAEFSDVWNKGVLHIGHCVQTFNHQMFFNLNALHFISQKFCRKYL